MAKHSEKFLDRQYEIYKAKYNGEALRLREIGVEPRSEIYTRDEFDGAYDSTAAQNYGTKVDAIVNRQLYFRTRGNVVGAASVYRRGHPDVSIRQARLKARTLDYKTYKELSREGIEEFLSHEDAVYTVDVTTTRKDRKTGEVIKTTTVVTKRIGDMDGKEKAQLIGKEFFGSP